MGPLEKIVDQIRGVLHFRGSFDGPRLGTDPAPKSVATPLALGRTSLISYTWFTVNKTAQAVVGNTQVGWPRTLFNCTMNSIVQ